MNTCKNCSFFYYILYFFRGRFGEIQTFCLYLQCSKIIDIFIRREVVDAHEMGIFYTPSTAHTRILYTAFGCLSRNLYLTSECCLLIFEQREMAAVLFSAYLLKNQ